MRVRLFVCAFVALVSSAVLAVEIEGVQPAALDQPRVHLHLRRQPNGPPLATGKGNEQTINIQAFLDTGASGIMLSKQTADALGVKRAEASPGKRTVFHDVGVGGSDAFNVSEPLFIRMAPSGKSGEPSDPELYPLSFGPARAQVGPLAGGLMQMLTGGLDVVGMPSMIGRLIIIDPKPVDTFADTMRAGVFDPKKDRGRIPKTDRHITLAYQSFERFTRTEPAGAAGPTLAHNPFIDRVAVALNGKRSQGSWLLDTGAAASMISKKQAAALGVRYVEGTEGTDAPQLAGTAGKDQFALSIGGVGGAKKVAGFFLDTLTLPTRERDPLVYKRAPVFVLDITVENPKTKEKTTLDGVFGMNFLAASAFVSEAGMLPDIGQMTVGPYEWIVFDEPARTLGLKLKKELAGK